MIRYLEHYCRLPSWKAYDGVMTDINLTSMTFLCGGKTYRVPLDPPMSSFRDARERAVQMDKESLRGLQKSDITVKEYVPPNGLYALEFLIIAATFVAYSQRSWFAKGAIVERLLGQGFARFSWTIQPWLIIALIGLHGSEAIYFSRKYLARHSVNIRTLLWWQWFGSAFIEGRFAYIRFNDHVAKKREEKEKQKR